MVWLISKHSLIAQALSTKIIDTPQKDKRHFLKIADLTVQENLKQHLASKFGDIF
jgi:excinuclease ABC subunit C